jgi:hypothetical protein
MRSSQHVCRTCLSSCKQTCFRSSTAQVGSSLPSLRLRLGPALVGQPEQTNEADLLARVQALQKSGWGTKHLQHRPVIARQAAAGKLGWRQTTTCNARNAAIRQITG